MTVYLSRAAWGARSPRGSRTLDPSRVRGVAIHWPAMKDPLTTASAVAHALRGWQDYHMDGRDWSDIAYQVAVDQAGRAWVLRGLGTRSAANGDEDVNTTYGAILLVLAPGETISEAMKTTVRNVVADFRDLYPKGTEIRPHSAVRPHPTDCPGDAARAVIKSGGFTPALHNSTGDDDMTDPQTKAQLDRIENKLNGIITVDAGRYKVDADRYDEFHATLGRILDELADDPASPLVRTSS